MTDSGWKGFTQVLDKSKDEVVRIARGLISETHDGRNVGSTAAFTSGVANFIAIGFNAGDLVSNIGIFISTAGAGLTASKVGLYDKAGHQLAVSADQGTSWQTAGYKRIPIAPVVISATDVYYAAVFCTFTTTAPQAPRGDNGAGLGSYSDNGRPANFYGLAGQADLTNPVVLTAGLLAGNFAFYMNAS